MNIGKGTKFAKKWTLGEKLGEGGCASVYALQETDPIIGSLVIKCTKLPTGKSKADKEQLKIANTLNYERMLYKGVLNDFKYCVKLPQQGYYGEENSVRYLVMARMDYDLRHLATMSHGAGEKGSHAMLSTQSLSLIGQQILEGLEILHSKGYLFVDVKPDNFMIRKSRSSSSSARGNGGGSSNEFTLADELFFVDFGLAEKFTQYMSNGAQRERTMRAGLAGTPSYASIDLLEGHSPCRKDDLEALGYVLLALCMGGRLPWDDARSNAECLRIKRDTDILALTRRLGCQQIGDFIVAIRESDPQSAPDYSALQFLLRDMASAAPSSPSPPVTEKPATQRSQKKSAAAPRSAAPEPEPVVSAVATPTPATRPKRKAASQTAKEIPQNISSKRPRSLDKGPFSEPHASPQTPTSEEEEEEEEEERGNTPVKAKTPSGPFDESWKERAVRKTTAAPTPAPDAVAIDLTDLTPSPAPSPPPPSVISSSRKHTRSKAPPRASSVVLTVRRCAAWPAYEGLQVSIPLPATAASPTRQRRSARKKSSEAVTVTIGALEECQHVFENDEFLSGRHAQVKVERLEEGREGGGEENSVAIRIKDLNSTNGTRRNGEDLQANRWVEVSPGDRLELGNTEFLVALGS